MPAQMKQMMNASIISVDHADVTARAMNRNTNVTYVSSTCFTRNQHRHGGPLFQTMYDSAGVFAALLEDLGGLPIEFGA
jgi:hypothetical protein